MAVSTQWGTRHIAAVEKSWGLANVGFLAQEPTHTLGRVGKWRGSSRFGLSVSAPFVWLCLSNLAVTPFPHPSHRTGHADFQHPALGQDLTPSPTTCRVRSDW